MNERGNEFYYIDIWASRIKRNIFDFNSTNNIIVYGEPGAGKSYLALLLAWRLKKYFGFNFNVRKDVVFTVEDAVARSFGRHRVIILDEGAFSVDKTSHMSLENKLMAGVLRMNRSHGNVFIFVAQEYFALDFRIRYFTKDVAHVRFDYRNKDVRYLTLYRFVDFERKKLDKQTFYYNDTKVQFKDIIIPDPRRYISDLLETYEELKEHSYTDVVLHEMIKLIKKRHEIKDDEVALQLLKEKLSRHEDVVDYNNINIEKKLQATKYKNIVEEIAQNPTPFFKIDDPHSIDPKKVASVYNIPRSSAYRVAKMVEAVLSSSAS